MIVNDREVDYWDNICEIHYKQTQKGIKEYGQTLEENTALDIIERIDMAEEEAVDLLMYLEHLKQNVENIRNLAFQDGYEMGSKHRE